MGKRKAPSGHGRNEYDWNIAHALNQVGLDATEQLGDFSDITRGDLSLSPEAQQYLSETFSGQRMQARQDYTEAERLVRANLAKRRRKDSSFEDVDQAILGRQHMQTLANLESQEAQARLQLPLQIAQMRISGQDALMRQLQPLLMERQTRDQERLSRLGFETQIVASEQTPFQQLLGAAQTAGSGGWWNSGGGTP
jgi:hypothetical protein